MALSLEFCSLRIVHVELALSVSLSLFCDTVISPDDKEAMRRRTVLGKSEKRVGVQFPSAYFILLLIS
jgi:hypothetical protein